MRKYYLFILVAALITAVSCKKDEDSSNPFDPSKKEYSKLTDEQNKENLISNAESFKGEMNKFENEEAMEVMENMGSLMSSSDQQQVVALAKTPLQTLKSAKSGDIKNALKALRNEDPVEDDIEFKGDFQALFDSVAGTYEWDTTKEDFNKSDTPTDAIILKFPGKETDVTNTASISITNFSVSAITEELNIGDSEELPDNLPTSVDVTLAYTGTTLLKWEYRGSFEATGMPTKISSELTVGKFLLGSYLDHSPYSKASHKETFQYDSKILLETYQEAGGNWSKENIEKVEQEGEENFQNIIQNANAYVQVMNLKLMGLINIKAAIEEAKAEELLGDSMTKEQAEKTAKILNDNAALALMYADSETKIASAEAYAKQYEDEWETYWGMGVYLVFSDGSRMDADEYFKSDEFAQIVADYEEWAEELEAKLDF